MKVKYDKEVDILCLIFSDSSIEESDEAKPGIIIDYDKDNNIVSIEILDASKRMPKPLTVEYEVA